MVALVFNADIRERLLQRATLGENSVDERGHVVIAHTFSGRSRR
jgi:hypothetical protein